MAENFLRLVQRGVRFDRQKLEEEKKYFQKSKVPSLLPTTANFSSDTSLDFFQNSAASDSSSSPSTTSPSTNSDNVENKKKKSKKTGKSVNKEENSINEDDKEAEAQALKQGTSIERFREIRAFRKSKNIHVQGSDIPDPFQTFAELEEKLKIPPYMITNLTTSVPEGFGYEAPTPIQMQSIPIIVSGRELLACAPTGSGKTAAFGIPLFAKLKNPGKKGFRAVVLAPTRELALQIDRHFNILTKGKKWRIYVLSKANANENAFGAKSSKRKDVLISTPMRLVHLLRNGGIDLSGVEILIMDEADRLFDLGFGDQVDEILQAFTNPKLKKCMFSATMMQGVEQMAKDLLRDPVRLTIGTRNAAASTVKQRLIFVGNEQGKLIAMRQLIQEGLNVPVLIFVQSKDRATQLFKELVYDNINVDAIHSQRTKAQRDTIVSKFRTGQIWVLICTDLMARGMDFLGVNCVINYDFPQSSVSYIHRIGRTGRAGRAGEAVTFYTESDAGLLRSIAKVMRLSGCDIPEWMLQVKPLSKKKMAAIQKVPPSRPAISTEVKGFRTKEKEIQSKKRLKRKKQERVEAKDGDGDENVDETTEEAESQKKKKKKSKKKKEQTEENAQQVFNEDPQAVEPQKKKKKKSTKKNKEQTEDQVFSEVPQTLEPKKKMKKKKKKERKP